MLKLFRQYYPIRNLFFVIGEGLLILSSVMIASWILSGSGELEPDSLLAFKILLVTLVCQVCLYYNDLYDIEIIDGYLDLGLRLFQALGFASILLAGIYMVYPRSIIGSGTFAVSTAIVVIFIFSWRVMYSYVLKEGWFDEKIIILGSGQLAADISREIHTKKDSGYRIEVIVLDHSSANRLPSGPLGDIRIQEGYERICEIAKEEGIRKIVVALEEKRGRFPTRELLACRVEGIEVLEGVSFYEMLTGKLLVRQIKPGWLIFSRGFEKSRIRLFFKRMGDVALSALSLVVLSPLMLITMACIRLDTRGPIFFTQERVGESRRPYKIYKFRSMVEDAELRSGPVWADEDDPRITRAGRFIRKWRIDELPQIWNVLKGEMSFVGPRPEREHFVRELEERIPYYDERFKVKPGITGWAQVNYGYGASVEDAVEKLNYDLFYIKNLSIFLDAMIVIKTVKIVIFGRGAR